MLNSYVEKRPMQTDPVDNPVRDEEEYLVERLPEQTNAMDEYNRKFDDGGY